MSSLPSWILAGITAAMLVSACSANQPAAPTSASREDTVTDTAQVRGVDQNTRQVLIRTEDGEEFTIVAGPEVRNLPQLQIGDTIKVTYYQAVAVNLTDPSDTTQPSATTVIGRAPEGAKPGMAAASTVNAVVEFVSYDPGTHVATYLAADGSPQSVVVHPEMRDFAAGLKPGDKVNATITNAVAVAIEERTK
jgi:hypothetical protein